MRTVEDAGTPEWPRAGLGRHILTGAGFGALVAGITLVPASALAGHNGTGPFLAAAIIPMGLLCLGLWQLRSADAPASPLRLRTVAISLLLGTLPGVGLGIPAWIGADRALSEALTSLLASCLCLLLGVIALRLARVRRRQVSVAVLPQTPAHMLAAGLSAVIILAAVGAAPGALTPWLAGSILSDDPLVSTTTTAPTAAATYPSVAQIAASASARPAGTAQKPAWQVPLSSAAEEIVSGSRGPIVVTGSGLYGLDAADGSVVWSLATAPLDGASGESLMPVPLYGDHLTFTSPDGARIAFAYRTTPKDSADSRTRVLVVATATGEVALDTQVPGAHPAVQLTDSLALVDHHVYDLVSSKELVALHDMHTPVAGPGGHTTAVVQLPAHGLNDSRVETASLITYTEDALRQATGPLSAPMGPDLESALTKQGQVLNAGGWVVTRTQEGDSSRYDAQNMDTGEMVPLGQGTLAAVAVGPQAIVAWTAMTPDDRQLAASHLYPATLTILDVRNGTTTQPDAQTVVSAMSPVAGFGSPDLGSSRTGVVDRSVFNLDLVGRELPGARLVLPMTQAAAAAGGQGVQGADGATLPWMEVDPGNLQGWSSLDTATVCTGGIVVAIGSSPGGNLDLLSAWPVGG